MKKNYFLALMLLITAFTVSAQKDRSDYENVSKWFLNLNAGATWQTTDVRTKTGGGLGFVLGHSFNYNYGKPISFDLRFRYLGGNWYGQNYDSIGFHIPNYTLSQGATNYKNELGYSVLNFRTNTHQFDLELAIHANRLRERTGLDPYIFGGVGFTTYRTKGNLLNSDDEIYRYDNLNFDFNKNSISSLLDKTYETPLDGSGQGYRIGFMPSVGIGIAYQTGPRFSIGIEHKTTFTLADNFDGYVNPSSRIKNDWFHYTNFFMKFRFKGGESRRNDPDRTSTSNNNGNNNGNGGNTEQPVRPVKPVRPVTPPPGQPPVVQFTNPNSSPRTINQPSFTIQAYVYHVNSYNDIEMLVNGQRITNFNFNSSDKSLIAAVNLNYGTNEVRITGRNTYGTDTKNVFLIYERTVSQPAPVVYFEDPANSPYTTSQTSFSLAAKALYVTGRQNVIFKQNGVVNNNFTFNSNTKDFRSNVVLNPGNNVFELIGSNEVGSDNAVTIIINSRATVQPPIVTITNPSVVPYNTTTSQFVLNSDVYNVNSSNEISVTLNGNPIQFNYNSRTRAVTANLNLVQGNNIAIVRAVNNVGSDQKDAMIIYRRANTIQPPVVTFIQPSVNNSTTESNQQTFSATVSNVSGSSDITVRVNGRTFTGFSYDANNTLVSVPVNLIEGANIVEIRGTNTAGSDQKTRTIYYKKREALPLPVVNFTNPVENPTTVYSVNYRAQAKVLNVEGSNNITLKINGTASRNFTYSPSSQLMDFTLSLVKGANLIEVTATNTAGSDKETTTIIYKEEDLMKKPEVKIHVPVSSSSNPFTTAVSTISVEGEVLNVDTRDKIFVQVNDQDFSNFDFNNQTKKITLRTALREGDNKVLITGVNAAGVANDIAYINYQPKVIRPLPVITYITPEREGITVLSSSYVVTATIDNVDNASQIILQKDGQPVSSGAFVFNAQNKRLTFGTTLRTGNNVFNIIASNESGTVSNTTSVNYEVKIECPVPEIAFITEKGNIRTNFSEQKKIVDITCRNISSAEELTYTLNGKAVGRGKFDSSKGIYTIEIVLNEGLNALEVIATNKCGTAKINTSYKYVPEKEPCLTPAVKIVAPSGNYTTENNSTEIIAGITNIKETSEITFKVNNVSKPFSYDAASKQLKATVSLTKGNNTVLIQVSNDCGSASDNVVITKTECEKPLISPVKVSAGNNSTTYSQSFTFNGSITNIESNNQITVSHNNTAVNFVYNPATRTVDLDRPLALGVNTIIITAKNACGSTTYTHKVTRQNDPNAQPPVIKIVQPSTSPVSSDDKMYTVKISTQYVTASYQVAVTVNGINKNFDFNTNDGSITLNLSLEEGNNAIVATAVTNYGSSNDSKTIIYKPQQTLPPPSIIMTSPSSYPAQMVNGLNTIKGRISNCTSISQVSFSIDGTPIGDVKHSFNGGALEFTLELQMSARSGNRLLRISVITPGGRQENTYQLTAPSLILKVPDGSVNIRTTPKNQPTQNPTSPERTPGNVQTQPTTTPTQIIRKPRE